ncbi:MAG TPA: hypothetical protein VH590_06805, partial [Ktedonobacterales bacterium]
LLNALFKGRLEYSLEEANQHILERMEEYKAVLESQAQISARRQHMNDVYIGLNTVFLTALGLLLVQSHLDTWWVFVVVCAIMLAILPINLTWRAALRRYGNSLSFRFDYVREIEQEFRVWKGKITDPSAVGLHLREKELDLQQKSNTQLEIRLATYFICLYPAIVVVVGVLVYLIQVHLIPPLKII